MRDPLGSDMFLPETCNKCENKLWVEGNFIILRNILHETRLYGCVVSPCKIALLVICKCCSWCDKYDEKHYEIIKSNLKEKAIEAWWEFQNKYAPEFYRHYYPLKHLYSPEHFQ